MAIPNLRPRRRTKIVATLGPASSTPAVIGELIDSGVNIFRLNFSHGTHEQHGENISSIRSEASKRNRHVGILGDLQGPKIRIGDIGDDTIALSEGDIIYLTTDEGSADVEKSRIPVLYKPLPSSVKSGDVLLLDDGRIRLSVDRVKDEDVHCTVIQAGKLSSRKGINRLGGGLAADAITEKDLKDLDFIVSKNLEYVAVSFPVAAKDLEPVKRVLAANDSQAQIITKIERAEVVATDEALDELIAASDGIMVARGDLGVEIGDPQLVGVQKKIIKHTRAMNKPVITATQMMESMIT